MKKYPTILILIIMVWASGFGQTVKVISFNIRYANESDGNNKWALRKSAVTDFVAYEAPDFIGLQEALLTQIEDMTGALEAYKWIGMGRDDGKKGGEFTPIFYDSTQWQLINSGTFWLSETPERPSKSWDAALPRICTWGKFRHRTSNLELFVFNTHFDHIGKLARENSSRLMLKKIAVLAQNNTTILLGDFNDEPASVTIKKIVQSSLLDAFTEAHVKFGQEGTFNGFDYESIPTRRIDYVFVSKNFEVMKYGVDSRLIDGRYLSDHFPVVVDLRRLGDQ